MNIWACKWTWTCAVTETDRDGTSRVKQLMPFWSCQTSQGPFQHSSVGEMISKAGNHSFNYIFRSLFSSPFSHPSALLPLYFCLYLASVFVQTFVTLPPSLWLLSFSVWSNGNCFFFSAFPSKYFCICVPDLFLPDRPMPCTSCRWQEWNVWCIMQDSTNNTKVLTFVLARYLLPPGWD